MSAVAVSDAAPVIAVDGPAASGKGTIAAGVARALGFHLLDSGSLYRLVALKALEAGHRARRRAGACRGRREPRRRVRRRPDRARRPGRHRPHPRGRTSAPRPRRSPSTRPCGRRCSSASGRSGARRAWSPTGATWARSSFPDATLKVFLTASAEERAGRRYKQLIDKRNLRLQLKVFCAISGSATRATRGRAAAPLKTGRRRRDPGYDRPDDRRRDRLRARSGTGRLAQRRSGGRA